MTTLLSLSLAVLLGLFMSRLAKLCKLPAVTAYLITGILIGPFCLGHLGIEGIGFQSLAQVEGLDLFSNVALGFIAFAIGNEFRLSSLQQTGKQAVIIGIVQALAATVLVDAVLIGACFVFSDKITMPAAITLGAIAAATAPAATLMVVRQYKAKGPLTDLLLPIVALDDAVGLVVFAVSFGIAKALASGTVDLVSILVNPLIEIAGSLLLGALMGYLLTFTERFFKSRSKRLSLSIAFVILAVALSMLTVRIGAVEIGFSALLTCMMLGTVFCNLCDFSEELMDRCDRWTGPLFVLFFVISGAELDLSVLTDGTVVLIGILYILARSLGKYIGAFGGAKATGCSKTIQKYLGITLLPQAGVALGMTLTAQELGGAEAQLIRNIVLFSVLIYELIGPMLTKMSLIKAGDVTLGGATNARTPNKKQ